MFVSAANPAPAFHLFGPAHLTIIGLTFGLPAFFWLTSRGPERESYRRFIRRSLALLLVANWAAYTMIQYRMNPSVARILPMQLCDWSTVTVAVALLMRRGGGRRQRWYELSYFWGLAGTFQAILTPNLQVGFPNLQFISFFVAHCGIVIGVLFLTAVDGMRPEAGSMLRTMAWSEVYLAVALAVNALTGENYGFLSHRPAGKSLLDYLSDNHLLYVVEMNLLAVFFFSVLCLPFWLRDLARGRSAS